MAAREVKRTLTVTADTSSLRKGAQEIQRFGQGAESATAYLKRMQAELSAPAYKSFAAGFKPIIAAEKEMALMAREAERALKPFAAEMRKTQMEALKASEALNKRTLSEAKAAEALRKTYDTGYRNAQAYLRVEEQVARQIEARNLTVEQGATVLQGAATRFKQFGTEAGAANQNVKLAAHEMVNLSRQGQDVATMFAMGMSPMQVFTSQAAQIYDAISSGEGGLAGGFQRLGNSVKAGMASLAAFAVSPAGIATALGAATAAAIYFATRSTDTVKTAEEALDRYKKLVDGLEGSYKRAGDAAERYMAQSQAEGPNVALAAIQGTAAEIRATLAKEIEGLYPKTQGFVASFASLTPEVLKGQDAIRALGDRLKSGELTAAQFREQIALLRVDPKTPPDIKKIADDLLAGSVNARNLANALGAAGAAADTVSGKTGRLAVPSNQDMVRPFGTAIDLMKRLQPDAFDDTVQGLKDQGDALTATTEKTRTYSDAVAEQRAGLASSIDQLKLQVDMFGQSEGAIAAARFQMDAMAEAQRQANDAKVGAIDPALVADIQARAAEYGRLTDQLKASTEAQREQTKAAEEAKRQQERLADFRSDLAFERSIAGLPEAEQRVRETLRRLDVDYESFDGQRLAAEIRYNDRLTDTRDSMSDFGDVAQDVFGTLIDSLGRGGSLLESLASAFAGLGKQLASAGFDRLFGGLFGGKGGDAKGGGLVGLLGQIGNAAPRIAANANLGGSTGYVPTPTARPADFGQAAAAVSGQVMTYAKRFNSGVDSRLMAILKEASANFPMRVEAMSGLRPGDPRFHGKGLATDVRIFDANGKALSNYQDGSSFRVYEQFAQQAKVAQEKLFPELGKLFRWGGYFSGAKGRYGALDTMHFDLGGAGMAGGSWENGLTPAMRRIWGDAESVGMGSRTADQRVVAQGVSQGMMDYSRRAGPEGYGGGRFDDAGAGGMPQMTRGQAGFGALAGLLGIAANGYQSGSPIMGGLSGAMGGIELGGMLGSAFPSLGAAAGPVSVRGGTLFSMRKKRA